MSKGNPVELTFIIDNPHLVPVIVDLVKIVENRGQYRANPASLHRFVMDIRDGMWASVPLNKNISFGKYTTPLMGDFSDLERTQWLNVVHQMEGAVQIMREILGQDDSEVSDAKSF